MSAQLHLAGVGATILFLVLMGLSGCSAISGLIDQEPSAAFKLTTSSGATVGTQVTLDATGSSDPQAYTLQYSGL